MSEASDTQGKATLLAGKAAAERLGADHVVAGDVIDELPRGFRSIP